MEGYCHARFCFKNIARPMDAQAGRTKRLGDRALSWVLVITRLATELALGPLGGAVWRVGLAVGLTGKPHPFMEIVVAQAAFVLRSCDC